MYDGPVRIAFALVLATGCSFSRGTTNQGPGDGSNAPIDSRAILIDAAADATADAATDALVPPPDAFIALCPAGYVTLAGAPTTSKYKAFSWSNSGGQDRSDSWTNAKQTCAAAGTHLAIVNSLNEATALQAAITRDPGSPLFWQGLTDAALEGTWLTVLNAPAPYLMWAMSQPNGGASANCALLYNGQSYDWSCGSAYPFACECE